MVHGLRRCPAARALNRPRRRSRLPGPVDGVEVVDVQGQQLAELHDGRVVAGLVDLGVEPSESVTGAAFCVP
jgi:hypothetical protein